MTIAGSDDLGWHAIVSKHFLVHLVVLLATEDSQAKCWMFELIFRCHHVLSKSEAELLFVLLIFHLDPVGFFDFDLELTRCLDKIIVDLISDSEVVSPCTLLVDHDPLFILEVDRILDGKLPENVLVNVDDLVVLEDLWSTKDMRLHFNGHLLDVEVPVLDRLLIEESVAHLLDLSHLLSWCDPCLSKGISHASTFAHTVWYSVEHAELRWQVVVLVRDLDEEEWLVEVGDLLVIDLREVLCN